MVVDYENDPNAPEELWKRAKFIKQMCVTAGHNLLIAQQQDTLRYAQLHSGGYHPRIKEFREGQFVYVRDPEDLHKKALPQILRVRTKRDTGVLVLEDVVGRTRVENLTRCSPCHLAILDVPTERFFAPFEEDLSCAICLSPTHDVEMMICDSCERGFHTFCIGSVLTAAQLLKKLGTTQAWVCSECLEAGIDPLMAVTKVVPPTMSKHEKAAVKSRQIGLKKKQVVKKKLVNQQTPVVKRKVGRPRLVATSAVIALQLQVHHYVGFNTGTESLYGPD